MLSPFHGRSRRVEWLNAPGAVILQMPCDAITQHMRLASQDKDADAGGQHLLKSSTSCKAANKSTPHVMPRSAAFAVQMLLCAVDAADAPEQSPSASGSKESWSMMQMTTSWAMDSPAVSDVKGEHLA